MPRFEFVNLETAHDATKKAYEKQLEQSGYVTNMKKTLLRSLPAYNTLMQWYTLRDEVAKLINKRGIVVFCHAISTQNNCVICSTYFRRDFKEIGVDPEEFELNEQEKLLETFGRTISNHQQGASEELLEELKQYFSEEEIILLTAFGSIMVATNIINTILKIDLDENLSEYLKK